MNCLGMRARTAVVLGAIVVGLPVFSPMWQAKKGPTTPTEATVPQLERDIPELMKKAGVPGLAISIIRGGKTTWLHGFGMKEVRTHQPVTGETVFEAASLSKPVFTYAVLKLVEQGKLGLDVPLTTYLPKPFVAGDERLHAFSRKRHPADVRPIFIAAWLLLIGGFSM
jgi:CubicO group peptidase (beta-lactamase class C family)